jgi:hypothetical protein
LLVHTVSKFSYLLSVAALVLFVVAAFFFTPAGRRALEVSGVYTECTADAKLQRASCMAPK